MIGFKVTYTGKAEFVNKNQENINLFMSDFIELPNNDFRYTAYRLADGKTFVHLSHYKNEAVQKQLLVTPSFQEQRDESGLEMLPQIEVMHPVASVTDIFK